MFCDKYAAYKAEFVWALKSFQGSMSAALYGQNIDVFEAIIPGKLLLGMLMSAKKAMYMITDGLYPHCKQSLMKDIGEAYLVLEYNKTTNSEGKKLQIRVHFWPFLKDQVGSCHLVMYFMEYATGEKIVKKS